jgi:hypothetical protein
MADYVTYSASISATANSTAVTGSGTAFVTDGVRSGDIAYFIESTGPVGYVIASVESATGLTLATEYEGSTAGSKTVVVTRRYGEESAADTYRLLNSYVQSLEDTVSVSQAGIRYAYSSTTGMADPGPGLFRLNNASAASATAIAIADESGETGNPDASAFINAFDDSTSSIKGYLYIKKAGSPQTFMVYAITALSDNSGWSQLTVTYITGSGSLTNNDAVRFEFYRTGNDGFENGLKYSYSTTTTDSDPGAGIFRFNNATFASITSIYIDNADFNGVTVTTLLDSWDNSANATNKGTLRFQKVGDPTVFREFTINGAITDGTGYRKIPVTPSVSNGTWTNGNNFVVLFTRTGDDGTDGYDPGFRFAFSTTTTDADPGAGTVRFDNANAALATYAYIDNADAAAADITAWLDGMDDSTESNHKGYLRIQKIGDPAIYREFVVTGTVVNGTGYRKVPIDLVSEAGSFSNGMGIVAHFTRTGSAGTNGTNGTDGYQAGYRLTYSTTTTAADPGAGTVRMNNLVMPSVTAIYIDNTDATGATITTWLDGLDDSDSAIRGYLRFQEATDPANYAEFGVNGAVVDSTGYRTVPVTAISSSGSWSNGDTLVATFYRSGSAGSATIADGSKGDVTVSGSGSVWEMTAATPLADLKTKWTPASASGAASLRFPEDTDNGTNKATLQGPSSLASDVAITLPSLAGTLPVNNISDTLTTGTIELGHVSDTTITRIAAGVPGVEGKALSPLVYSTVTSVSGTAVDFTGIPSWAREIFVMLNGTGLNDAGNLLVQLGDSGGVETTGYEGGVGYIVITSPGQGAITTGFMIIVSNAARGASGVMHLTKMQGYSTGAWVAQGIFQSLSGGEATYTGGFKNLSADLDRIRLTSSTGGTFDSGVVQIAYR